jgi:hypothetical protein
MQAKLSVLTENITGFLRNLELSFRKSLFFGIINAFGSAFSWYFVLVFA